MTICDTVDCGLSWLIGADLDKSGLLLVDLGDFGDIGYPGDPLAEYKLPFWVGRWRGMGIFRCLVCIEILWDLINVENWIISIL